MASEKVNLQIAVRNAMRARLITAKIIDATRIQLPNVTFKKPTSGIWIRESINEGSEEPKSNAAGREFAVVNYEVFCKATFGADAVDAAVEAIRLALPVLGANSEVYNANGQYAYIKSIDKPAGGIDSSDPAWYRRLVAVTVELYNP